MSVEIAGLMTLKNHNLLYFNLIFIAEQLEALIDHPQPWTGW